MFCSCAVCTRTSAAKARNKSFFNEHGSTGLPPFLVIYFIPPSPLVLCSWACGHASRAWAAVQQPDKAGTGALVGFQRWKDWQCWHRAVWQVPCHQPFRFLKLQLTWPLACGSSSGEDFMRLNQEPGQAMQAEFRESVCLWCGCRNSVSFEVDVLSHGLKLCWLKPSKLWHLHAREIILKGVSGLFSASAQLDQGW